MVRRHSLGRPLGRIAAIRFAFHFLRVRSDGQRNIRCPLWVISGLSGSKSQCPLVVLERTFVSALQHRHRHLRRSAVGRGGCFGGTGRGSVHAHCGMAAGQFQTFSDLANSKKMNFLRTHSPASFCSFSTWDCQDNSQSRICFSFSTSSLDAPTLTSS